MAGSKVLIFAALLLISMEANAFPLCLAHRAEHAKNAENSVEGVREALLLGADGVELDLRHTSDGVAIGMHDFILWRVAGSKSGRTCPQFTPISSLTFAEIRQNCVLKNSQEIPSLEEMLRATALANAFVLLQLKDDPSSSTLDLIKKYPNHDRLRIHSHWDSALEKFEEFAKENAPEVKTLKISKYWPRISETRGNDLWWFMRWILHLKPEIRNRETGLFLVDLVEDFQAAIRLKVDFITTDNPSICAKIK